jgi:hypothetical protein
VRGRGGKEEESSSQSHALRRDGQGIYGYPLLGIGKTSKKRTCRWIFPVKDCKD